MKKLHSKLFSNCQCGTIDEFINEPCNFVIKVIEFNLYVMVLYYKEY